jgi:hypothetical protein
LAKRIGAQAPGAASPAEAVDDLVFRSPELDRGVLKAHPRLWGQLRSKLHQQDFTVQGLERLVREHLLVALYHLRQRQPNRFHEALERLENGTPKQIEREIQQLVLQPLGLSDRFELKVPVAVPISAVRYIETKK